MMPEWSEIILRSLTAILVLFLMTKLLGKRQITELSLFEYITGITIGNLAAHISLEANWYFGILSLSVWVSVLAAIQLLSLKSKLIRNVVVGKGTVLIKEGKVLEDHMKKERISIDELSETLRKRGIFRIADVEFAIMESSGEINTLLKREHLPLTPSHLGLQVSPEREAQTVIMDGVIMDDPLASIGKTRQWLLTELEKLGLGLDNIFLGQVDTYGLLYVDTYDDQLSIPAPQLKAVLLSDLKKCEADLELFSLSTRNEEAKMMYEQCARRLEQVIVKLKPLLKQ